MEFKNPMQLKLVAGSFYKPKYDPAKPDGDDTHFISEAAQVIGVADGVGVWSKRGIDAAGGYARQLMRNAEYSVKYCSTSAVVDPKNVLEEAFLRTTAEGASTACIMCFGGKVLRAANLGDSGFIVVRRGDVVYTSKTQHRAFNVPYQLGHTTESLPEHAEEMAVELQIGDVIVAGTDGLFDNLFPEDIEAAVVHCAANGHPPAVTARALALMALSRSLEEGFSPFEIAAREAGFESCGGKYDDITAIVAYVVPRCYVPKCGI